MRHLVRFLVLFAVAGGALLLGEGPSVAQTYYGPAYGPAYGPPPAYRPAPRYAAPYANYGGYGYHTHDGFYLRVFAGFGYLVGSETYAGYDWTYSGAGVSYGAAAGGVIAPNLILYGEVFGTSIPNADLSLSNGGGTGPSGFDMTLTGFGPGIAYYFEPVNLYLSGTLALTKVSFSDTTGYSSVGDTDLGFGASFMVGKEWWVSRDWGLGVAGQLYFGTMKDHPEYYAIIYDTRLDVLTLSVLFSATYN